MEIISDTIILQPRKCNGVVMECEERIIPSLRMFYASQVGDMCEFFKNAHTSEEFIRRVPFIEQ